MAIELTMHNIEQEARAIASRVVMGRRDLEPETNEQAMLHHGVARETFYVIAERLWRAHDVAREKQDAAL